MTDTPSASTAISSATSATTPATASDPLQFFAFAHLPPILQGVSAPFHGLAKLIIDTLPDNRERDKALDRLLEAKDAAVRAKLFK